MEGYVVSISYGGELHGITPHMFHRIYTLKHTYTHKNTHTLNRTRRRRGRRGEEERKRKKKRRGKEVKGRLKTLNQAIEALSSLEKEVRIPFKYIYVCVYV